MSYKTNPQNDLSRIIQIALLGEVPPTLRFIYAKIENDSLYFHAVFTENATDDHLNSASIVATEVVSHFDSSIHLQENIERNDSIPWRIGSGENLFFLRYGELNDI